MRVLIVFCVIICFSTAIEHHTRTEANSWFSHLEHVSTPPKHDKIARKELALCCHSISFQETVEGEWGGRVSVPFDHWLDAGKVRLGVAYRVEDAVAEGLELTESGLMVDGSLHSEVYLRIQCSYPCCLEAISMLRPESDPYSPIVSAAAMDWDSQRGEEDAFTLREYGPSQHGRGLASQHLFVMPRTDQYERIQELDVCDPDGKGIYVRISLTQRREYAIAELDLCFLNTDLGHEEVNSWCHEEPALWSILEEQNRE